MKRPLIAALVLVAAAIPAAAYDVAGMRDAMREVFKSMRVLLEKSQSTASLADPANERAILAAANELADQASMISGHAPRDEVSFLAGSLDRYAKWIRRSYEWRRHDAMQKLVHDAVDVCIACHTRLPSRSDSPVAENFIAGDSIAALPAAERAKLQIATRRFDDAMKTLEALLPALSGTEFDRAARDYLVLAVRVKGDARRARRTLEALAGSAKLDPAHRRQVDAWAGALQHLEVSPPISGSLDAGRALVHEAEARRDSGKGDALVEYVAASRVLYEYMERGATTGTVPDGAEAYYLLGLTQYRIERSAWLPQAELFLEKAIRTAPASPAARRALALLQQKIDQGFAAQGIAVPVEVVRHLQMLRDMVEAKG